MAFYDIQFVNLICTNQRWLAVGAPRNEQCIAQLHKAIAFSLYLEAFSAKGWSPGTVWVVLCAVESLQSQENVASLEILPSVT